MKHCSRFISHLSCLLLMVVGLYVEVRADGIDTSFNAQIQTTAYLQQYVARLIVLPDGKILAEGVFNHYNGRSVGRLIRLNADASLDLTFNSSVLGAGSGPTVVVPQPDGKILVGGTFNLSDGTPITNRMIRLNANGTLDTSFDFQATGPIGETKIDASGRVVVSGFLQYQHNGNTVTKRIIRLNDDGSIDTSLDAQPEGGADRVGMQGNKFLYVNQDASQQFVIRRLNEDGSPDGTFSATPMGSFQILGVMAQPDNKILVLSDNRVFRLNADGGTDAGFQIPPNFPAQARGMLLHSDGRITVCHGNITPWAARVIRVLPNGASDPTFTPYNFIDNHNSASFAVQTDGGVLLADRGNNITSKFMRLLPGGSVDTSFNLGGTAFQNINPGKVRAIAVLASGKILIGGDFDRVNNTGRPKVARLNDDSSLDLTFQINTTPSGNYFSFVFDVYNLSQQTDGKILMSGAFTYFVNGVEKRNVVRLNTDGSIDPTFVLGVAIGDRFGPSNLSSNRTVQRADGKITVGTTRGGTIDPAIVPLGLNSDGSKDTGFNPTLYTGPMDVLNAAFDVVQLPSGKILIAGRHDFGNVNGTVSNGFVARLNTDGTVDAGFQIFETLNVTMFRLSLLQNGHILVVSRSDSASRILRLNDDGSVDGSFNAASVANGRINAMVLLPNGKIIAGGSFSTYGGLPRRNLALLNSDGTVGPSIGNTNGEVLSIAVDPQGRVLVGGQFTTIDSGGQQAPIAFLARLSVASSPPIRALFDFDGDGKDDVSVYRNGIWYLLRSQLGFSAVNWGLATDKTIAGDYDGDGKADTAVFRDGAWIILNSSNGAVSIVNWGLAGDIPMVGDYDGDNKTDLTVFRNGTWYILQSSNGGFVAASFGLSTDKPVVGKFDADNRSDIAVFRNGNWYILGSLSGFSAVGFGTTGDVAVPADYDGDGRTDVAVFRSGNWYILGSSAGFSAVGWGLGTDTAVPADYDGDGKSDVAVFRNGNWYILQSSNGGFSAVAFGTTGDKPIPAQLQ